MLRLLSLLSAGLVVAGCATVGQGFDPAGVAGLVPGESTLGEARVLLKASPTQTYAAANGAVQALWYAGLRGPVDSHASRSVLLAFGPDGRFRQVLDARGVILDEAATDRQRRQAACLEVAPGEPCDAYGGPAAPAAVQTGGHVPAAPAPAGCYAAGEKVVICPAL
ncbi:hypothetical protein GCM10025795_29070 [Verticiella sediminum]